MAAKILNLIYRVKDEGSVSLRKMKKEQTGLMGEMKASIPVFAAAGAAIGAIGAVAAQTFGKYQDYINEVSKFNSMINGTHEETSMLVRMMKDYGVSQDTMLAAMRTLAQQGYDPSIKSLIMIRDKLNAVTSDSERLAMAQKLIGEQGIKQLLPMFEEMGIELDNYVEGFDEGLVVTAEMEERQIALAKQTANLTAEWDKQVLAFGEHVTPGVMSFVEWLNDPTWIKDIERELTRSEQAWADRSKAMAKYYEGLREVTGATEELTEAQLLQKAYEAIMTGDRAMAQMYANQAFEVERNVDAVRDLIQALDDLDGKKIGYEIMGMSGQFTPEQIERAEMLEHDYPWIDEPRTTTGGVIHFGGETFNNARWSGDKLQVWRDGKWQTYGVFPGHAFGGEFTVGGVGGSDTQLVQFRATPGEKVRVGGSDDFAVAVLAEMRRLANTLPVAIRDAGGAGDVMEEAEVKIYFYITGSSSWLLIEDVMAEPNPTWEYGLVGVGPSDLLASTGILTFTLDNGEEK